jgi:hypothetical protein
MRAVVQHTLATATGASSRSWQTPGRKQRQMEVTILAKHNTTLTTICASQLRHRPVGCLLSLALQQTTTPTSPRRKWHSSVCWCCEYRISSTFLNSIVVSNRRQHEVPSRHGSCHSCSCGTSMSAMHSCLAAAYASLSCGSYLKKHCRQELFLCCEASLHV